VRLPADCAALQFKLCPLGANGMNTNAQVIS
jgi:hypothetical protein